MADIRIKREYLRAELTRHRKFIIYGKVVLYVMAAILLIATLVSTALQDTTDWLSTAQYALVVILYIVLALLADEYPRLVFGLASGFAALSVVGSAIQGRIDLFNPWAILFYCFAFYHAMQIGKIEDQLAVLDELSEEGIADITY